MDNNNTIKNYNVSLEALAPVFIGSGKEIGKAEYIRDIKTGKIYIMDPLKMFNGLKKLGLLKKYETFMSESNRANLSSFVSENGIGSQTLASWSSYSYAASRDYENKNSNIMACIKDPYNLPYIPGSSLKGALRNALSNALLFSNSEKYGSLADSAEKAIYEQVYKKDLNKELSKTEKNIDVKLYHRKRSDANVKIENAVNSIFRGFIVSDSKPLKTEDIVLCGKHDMLPDGHINKIGIFRECIKPGTVIEFSLSIDSSVFKYRIEDVEKAVRIMYHNYYNNFISVFPNNRKERGNIIFIGGGAGFVTKTIQYSLFKEKYRAVKNTSLTLHKVFNDPRKGGKRQRMFIHDDDPKRFSVSPRTRKCTVYNNRTYDFGMCRIDFQPM